MKKVLVLGAGYGGVIAALRLHKKLKRRKDVEITLIDQNNHHTLLTELHEVAGNRVEEDAVLIPLRRVFQYTKVNVVRDRIVKIDYDKQEVSSEHAVYAYDYLILAFGSEPAYFGIEGMEEHGLTLWSHSDAVRIKEHIASRFALAKDEHDPVKRRQLLTFVVGGGGFTGIEMVGELARWKDELCYEHGIRRSDVRLIVIEALPKILPVLSDDLIAKSEAYLTQKLNVEVLTDCRITRVTAESVQINGRDEIPTETMIWTGGVQSNDLVAKSGIPAAKRGRVEVNEYLQTSHENVYAIGDNAAFTTADGFTLPALVEAAMQTGHTAADNIIADIKKQQKHKCKPALHGVMVSIGRWYGVADLMGVKLSGILAIIMKHIINLHYLFEIGGFETCIDYLSHEFMRRRPRRNFVEGHLQIRRPVFFLVPIRIYLGYMWLVSGLRKVNQGWLKQVSLTAKRSAQATGSTSASVATDAAASASTAVVDTVASASTAVADAVASASTAVADTVASASTAAADAVASASTAAVEATGRSLMNLVGQLTPDWYAWILENFIVPNAMIFQWVVVLTELGLGIAFVTGTFTFLAGIVSVGMNINFLLSTGLYDYWYIMASIAVMAGAGRIWGLDYYIMPYLMRQWRYFVRNKWVRIFLFESNKLDG